MKEVLRIKISGITSLVSLDKRIVIIFRWNVFRVRRSPPSQARKCPYAYALSCIFNITNDYCFLSICALGIVHPIVLYPAALCCCEINIWCDSHYKFAPTVLIVSSWADCPYWTDSHCQRHSIWACLHVVPRGWLLHERWCKLLPMCALHSNSESGLSIRDFVILWL